MPNTEAAEDENTLTKAIDTLTLHFEDNKNIVFEKYQFREARQVEDKTILASHTRLKNLAQTCEFADVDREIIRHCTSTKLRRKGLNEPTVSLNDLLDYGRTLGNYDYRPRKVEQGSKQAPNRNRHKAPFQLKRDKTTGGPTLAQTPLKDTRGLITRKKVKESRKNQS